MTPVFEIEYADDPEDLFKSPGDLPVFIDNTAAVAIQRPAFGRRDDIAKRSNTVLMRHYLGESVSQTTLINA